MGMGNQQRPPAVLHRAGPGLVGQAMANNPTPMVPQARPGGMQMQAQPGQYAPILAQALAARRLG